MYMIWLYQMINTEDFILNPDAYEIKIGLVNIDGRDNGVFFTNYRKGDKPGAEITDSLVGPGLVRHRGTEE